MNQGGSVVELIVGSAGLGVLCGFIIGYGVACQRCARQVNRP